MSYMTMMIQVKGQDLMKKKSNDNAITGSETNKEEIL